MLAYPLNLFTGHLDSEKLQQQTLRFLKYTILSKQTHDFLKLRTDAEAFRMLT
jgi:hypothetical protein